MSIIVLSGQESLGLPNQNNSVPSQQNDTDEPDSTNREISGKQKRPGTDTHLLIVLIANIIFVVIIAIIGTLQLAEFAPVTLCGSDTTITYSLSILIILVSHFLWRIISPALAAAAAADIKIFGAAIPIGALQAIIDTVHPWKLSDRAFWPVIVIGIVAALFSLLAVPINNQPVPTLIRFSISVDDGSVPARLSVGTPLELQPGQVATVEALIGELKGANCSWESLNGDLVDVTGCKTTYEAPQSTGINFLHVDVASRCSRNTLLSALVVNISDSMD